jgi:hypothetical protein
MCAKSQECILYPLSLGDEVNFRLSYRGPLKAASQSSTRRVEKKSMRLAFDEQLNGMFPNDELLMRDFSASGGPDGELAKYERGIVSYWPIVRKSMHMVCDLDILFLRRGIPGRIVSSSGDLDNRIKVLFDALRVPSEDEIRGLHEESRGITCLLEDDELITGFRVTSDQLLEPAKDNCNHDVHLIINVEIRLTKITDKNLGYLRTF